MNTGPGHYSQAFAIETLTGGNYYNFSTKKTIKMCAINLDQLYQ